MKRWLGEIINLNKMNRFISSKTKDCEYYREISVKDLETPITVLLGPNGTGKSMSLRSMKEYCKTNNIKYASYSTSNDDIVSRSAPAFGNWDISGIACAFHSEGERMCDSFFKWAETTFVRTLLEDKQCPVYIFIDEADSGLSIDRIIQSLIPIKDIIKMDIKHRDLHVVFTCNSYELLEVLQSDITTCIWVPTKEKIEINSYEEFKSLYMHFYEAYFED